MVKVIDQKKSAFHAKNILSHAKVRGLSLREVAKRMGIGPSYLSELANGKRNWNFEREQALLSATDRP
jgi:transcriptional regulator with XRE-family HTH domain